MIASHQGVKLIVAGCATVVISDARAALAAMPADSLDAALTDPPYELGFMGKAWDSSGVAFNVEFWRGVLRVLKPGAHLLAFGHSRTYHRMTCAIEDAGFEIRDSLDWIYGSGFPKSKTEASGMPPGQGTALKPGKEPIVMARKPLIGTLAENIARYGTGGLWIDACRLPTTDDRSRHSSGAKGVNALGHSDTYDSESHPLGRWPANVLLDEEAAAELDAQSGAARFFYVAKPGRKERDAGCDHLPAKSRGEATGRKEGSAGMLNPRAGAGGRGGARNYHPTVKPVTLMRYLLKLITPPGGVVLDPFTGSGTTGVAALLEQRRFIGTELTDEYAAIIDARLEHAAKGTPT